MEFPKGLEPKSKEEETQWLLRALKEIEAVIGSCRITVDVSQCTLVALSSILDEGITESSNDPTENCAEEWFKQRTLEDLRKLRAAVDEADNESKNRHLFPRRPKPYDMKFGRTCVVTFTREWMELVMKEELQSVKLPRVRQA